LTAMLPPGSATDSGAGEDEVFEDVFAMMQAHWKKEASQEEVEHQEVPPAKRRRAVNAADTAEGGCGWTRLETAFEGESATSGLPVDAGKDKCPPASSSSASMPEVPEDQLPETRELVRQGPSRSEPPPEKVIKAYDMLGLPLSASAGEIERRSRRLARNAHPDKVSPDFPEQRLAAEARFQELQDAKTVALGWAQFDPALDEDDENSEEEAEDSVSEEHDERRQELKACGLDPDAVDWCDEGGFQRFDAIDQQVGASNDDEGSDDDKRLPVDVVEPSKGQGDLQAKDVSMSMINVQDNVLQQVRALNSHIQANRADEDKICMECFQRKAEKDSEVCDRCRKYLRRLERELERPVRK